MVFTSILSRLVTGRYPFWGLGNTWGIDLVLTAQHTPAVIGRWRSLDRRSLNPRFRQKRGVGVSPLNVVVVIHRTVHQFGSISPKRCSLFWFGVHVDPHLIRGKIGEFHFSPVGVILSEVVLGFDVLGALRT